MTYINYITYMTHLIHMTHIAYMICITFLVRMTADCSGYLFILRVKVSPEVINEIIYHDQIEI